MDSTDLVEFWCHVPEFGFAARDLDPSGENENLGSYLIAQPGGSAKAYRPLDESGLFKELAATGVSVEAIESFASRYGLLGGNYTKLIRLPIPDQRNAFFDIPGESVADWRTAISELRDTVQFWQALQAGDEAVLRRRIVWRGLEPDAYGGPRVAHETDSNGSVRAFEIASANHPELLARFEPGELIGPGWYALQRLVNWQLRHHGAFPQLFMSDRPAWRTDPMRMRFVPRSLISAIWIQFAKAIEGNRAFAQCAQCGRWFEVAAEARADAKFCKNACRFKAYRRRQSRARELAADGKSVREIAAELESDVKTVKGWISK